MIHALVISADAALVGELQAALAGRGDVRLSQVATLPEVRWHLEHDPAQMALLHLDGPANHALLDALDTEGLPLLLLLPPRADPPPLVAPGLWGILPLPAGTAHFGEALGRALDLVGRDASPAQEPLAELHRRSLVLAALLDAARALASLAQEEALLSYLVDVAVHLTVAEEGAILMPTAGDESRLDVRARCGAAAGGPLRVQESLALMTYRSGKPMLVADPAQMGGGRGRPAALINVPMGAQGRAAGVLSVMHRADGRAFNQEDVEALAALAGLGAMALENARLHTQTRQREATQVFRETVAALSHHVNNPLAALMAGIHALTSQINGASSKEAALETLTAIQRKAREIAVVIAVLQEVAVPTSTQYWQEERMIDIEAELSQRLKALDK